MQACDRCLGHGVADIERLMRSGNQRTEARGVIMVRDKDVELVDDDDRFDEEDEGFEDLEEVESARGIVGFLSGLLLGALIGAGVALLLAPERGDVTRRRIGTRLHDAADDARDQIDEWRDSAGRELRRGRKKLTKKLRRD